MIPDCYLFIYLFTLAIEEESEYVKQMKISKRASFHYHFTNLCIHMYVICVYIYLWYIHMYTQISVYISMYVQSGSATHDFVSLKKRAK